MIYPEDNRDRNTAITSMYAEGYSYGYIARELRLTRNQVAGVVHRAGTQRRKGVKHKHLPIYNTPEYWSAA